MIAGAAYGVLRRGARAPVTHRIKLQQVTRWAEGGGKIPRDVMERNRIQKLLRVETGQ